MSNLVCRAPLDFGARGGVWELLYDPDGCLAQRSRVPMRCTVFGWRLAGLAGLVALGG